MTGFNDGNMPAASRGVTTEMAVSRQAQEVQAAMVVAKRFPRDETASYNRILRACERKGLAEQALYEYPRGDTRVSGPSIRLAEAMAQNWGNLDFGIMELEQKNGESTVMAYAWDLETNTRQTKVFTVPHIRSTKKGKVILTDPRDIYELVANQGARRLRACILGIIPGDVIDGAVERCNKTLLGDGNVPMPDLIRQVTGAFEAEYGVTIPMLEKFIGCRHESFSMANLSRLKKVYMSLRDGMAKKEDYFDIVPERNQEVVDPFQQKGKAAGNTEKGKGKKLAGAPAAPEGAPAEGSHAADQAGDQPMDPAAVPPDDMDTPFH